jgi:hypothetical protein
LFAGMHLYRDIDRTISLPLTVCIARCVVSQ